MLNEVHSWPSLYPFKFIVPADQGKALEALMPPAERTEVKPSSGNKYLAYTFHCAMGSANEVLLIYAKVKTIKGVIAL